MPLSRSAEMTLAQFQNSVSSSRNSVGRASCACPVSVPVGGDMLQEDRPMNMEVSRRGLMQGATAALPAPRSARSASATSRLLTRPLFAPGNSRERPKRATPVHIVPWVAASSCTRRATWRRARRPTLSISKAIRTTRRIAERSARKAQGCSKWCIRKPARSIRRFASRDRQFRARILGHRTRPRRAADERRPR